MELQVLQVFSVVWSERNKTVSREKCCTCFKLKGYRISTKCGNLLIFCKCYDDWTLEKTCSNRKNTHPVKEHEDHHSARKSAHHVAAYWHPMRRTRRAWCIEQSHDCSTDKIPNPTRTETISNLRITCISDDMILLSHMHSNLHQTHREHLPCHVQDYIIFKELPLWNTKWKKL